MEVWSLSFKDNIASYRQTQALADAIRDVSAGRLVTRKHFTPQAPDHATKASANLTATWLAPLTASELSSVVCPEGPLVGPWPDMVVSCRPEIAAVALGIKEASGGRTQIIQIQNPNDRGGVYRFDRSAFDAIVAQPQEHLSGPNIITTQLALHGLTPEILAQQRAATDELCQQHGLCDPSRPLIAYMVGGSDEVLTWGNMPFVVMSNNIMALARKEDAPTVCVLTSRRTGDVGTRILSERLAIGPDGKSTHKGLDIRLNTPASYMALLTHNKILGVTAESLSMLSEGAAAGGLVCADDLDGILTIHPVYPFVEKAIAGGLIKPFAAALETSPSTSAPTRKAIDETPAVARAVLKMLGR